VVVESADGRVAAEAADFDGEVVGAGDEHGGRDPAQVPDPAGVELEQLHRVPRFGVPHVSSLQGNHGFIEFFSY